MSISGTTRTNDSSPRVIQVLTKSFQLVAINGGTEQRLHTKEIADSSLHGNLLRSCVTFRSNCRRKEKQTPRRARSTRGGSSTSPRQWVEKTSEREEDEERRGQDKDQSKYPAATTNTTVMTYVESGYLPKDRSSGRRPSLPATTESPLFTWSVGQKNPLFGTVPQVVASF